MRDEDEHEDLASEEERPEPDGNAGPAEDLETDPAYSPEDPDLKKIKGG